VSEPLPSSQPQWSGAGPSGPRAGFGRRLVAYIIDTVLVLIPYLILLATVDLALAYALWLAMGIVYYTYFEGRPGGQTLGKMALGIRVVDYRTGGTLGYGRAFVRWLARILSGIPCALGYLWMLWDREKQTWHDKLSTSVVVPTSAYPVS
jgi:uncharacterized RDD family membrane protein YckC